MKRLKDVLVALVTVCFVAPVSTHLCAEEWSAAQKNVWKDVEAYWALEAREDLRRFFSDFRPDDHGWSSPEANPAGKGSLRNQASPSSPKSKSLIREIRPVAIQIHGNFAFVRYSYAETYTDAEGKEKAVSGRWSDVLMKRGDRWVLVGDHAGRTAHD